MGDKTADRQPKCVSAIGTQLTWLRARQFTRMIYVVIGVCGSGKYDYEKSIT